MADPYRKNHYVPVWYQKRFIPPTATRQELFYRDLLPGLYTDPRGVTHEKKSVFRWGPKKCFFQDDLYTSFANRVPSTSIEQFFFGRVDDAGRRAVSKFGEFSPSGFDRQAFHDLLTFMGTQKLRTPKGLEWLRSTIDAPDRESLLQAMQELRRLYSAIWAESVWLIADAHRSATKFIVSDHPVTVYNRACPPASEACAGAGDPNVLLNASHTVFPLSMERILVLTNLSWARNPYQDPLALRPNPSVARTGIFKLLDVQTERHLSEDEVIQVNYIIKSRAHRYIAAADKRWLYPEEHSATTCDWSELGDGYLLMPDPRALNMGGTTYLGFDDGRSAVFDEYGRKPWDSSFQAEAHTDTSSLYRFQGEFARLVGPERRGRTFAYGSLESERFSDVEHSYYLELETESLPG